MSELNQNRLLVIMIVRL